MPANAFAYDARNPDIATIKNKGTFESTILGTMQNEDISSEESFLINISLSELRSTERNMKEKRCSYVHTIP